MQKKIEKSVFLKTLLLKCYLLYFYFQTSFLIKILIVIFKYNLIFKI